MVNEEIFKHLQVMKNVRDFIDSLVLEISQCQNDEKLIDELESHIDMAVDYMENLREDLDKLCPKEL